MSAKPIPALMMIREANLGGIERDVSKFARHLSLYGIEPHVACFNPGGFRWAEMEAAGVPLLPLPVTSFRSKSAWEGARTLRKYIREHSIQVLHAFDVPTDVFGIPVGRMSRVPVTLSSQLCYRELSPPAIRALLTVVDRLCTAMFVNCQAIADHLAEDWKVSRKRIRICHNGVETSEFHARGRARPEALKDASVVIGTVSVLREEKNLGLLLEAFAEVRKADRQARLLIVGDGPEKEKLHQQARDLQLEESCIFEPATAKPAEWMRAIDVFTLPSRSEAFSNALLEAMACGCCPVGSGIGGTPELIEAGERGLMFAPGDVKEFSAHLMTLAQDEPKRRAMGEAAAKFASEKLNIEIAASRLAGIYRELLGPAAH